MSKLGMDAASRTGNIEKAVIEIIDMRERKVIVEPPVKVQGGGLTEGLPAGAGLPTLNAFNTLAGIPALTDTVSDIANDSKLNVLHDPSALISGIKGATQKLFYVQFNPSELSLSGYGGGLASKTDFSENGNGITFEKAEVRITLNVKLIFDKVDPQDAFMSDKANTSTTAMSTGIAKAALKAKGKKDNSVQTEVEGFIAALRSKYTRRITFHWGTMTYTGVLNRVSSQYTMFNVQGLPVRAFVNLSLVCADEGVSPNSMGGWQTYYQELFKDGNQSYVKAAQKVGNLVNFNL